MARERKSTGGRRPAVTVVPSGSSARGPASPARPGKPTVTGLGVDIAALDWQRSGTGPGSFEVAFVARSGTAARGGDAAHDPAAEWVLLRVADDPAARVLVYDRNEWLCFLDGVVHGEFDRREGLARRMAP